MLSEECVEDISIKRPYFYTIKEYALSSTIHGIGYIFETNRLIFERLLWIIVLIVAVLIGTLLSIYTYKSWQDDPILTSVGTTGQWHNFTSLHLCSRVQVWSTVSKLLCFCSSWGSTMGWRTRFPTWRWKELENWPAAWSLAITGREF